MFLKIIRKAFLWPVLFLLECVLAFVCVLLIFILLSVQISNPSVHDLHIENRKQVGLNHYTLGKNYLKKNEYGIWEMYLEGDPYERGLVYGKLAKELVQQQETVFVDMINQLVPNAFWQEFLRLFIGFFNGDLQRYIPKENQQEIYGISQSFSDKHNHIAPKFQRILNYHAAHDIGHALNDFSLVGCTSFSGHGKKTTQNELIIGRNFDFYVSDAFAQEKLIVFINPTQGYKFASYSWAGFTGVVSGLNEKGLSVTLNASKSDLPTGSRMPISLLAREILQYASNIQEAIAIARKRKTFVSETLMIGSAEDGKTVLIEKSPSRMGVFDSNKDELICSNHYQSKVFHKDPSNLENIKNSDSKFRFSRVQELLNKEKTLTVQSAVQILRDQHAQHGDTLGMGNPRAINQLIAHHSVVILPKKKQLYISTTDFQLGPYIAYDLKQTFATGRAQMSDSIAAAAFISSAAYRKFKEFQRIKRKLRAYLLFDSKLNLSAAQIKRFISLNAESYITYELIGRYYLKKRNQAKAKFNFQQALSKNVASKEIEIELKKMIQKCRQK
jgi:isopenicillin-N N-acyltransferase-like protein